MKFGLEVTDSAGNELAGESIFVGALGEIIDIPPKSDILITFERADYDYIIVPCNGWWFGGVSLRKNSDGTANINNSSARGFNVAMIRGMKK